MIFWRNGMGAIPSAALRVGSSRGSVLRTGSAAPESFRGPTPIAQAFSQPPRASAKAAAAHSSSSASSISVQGSRAISKAPSGW